MHSYINLSASFWSSFAFFDVVLAYGSHYFLYIFEIDASFCPNMCRILVSFFDMGNVVYGSFVVEALSIVDTLFFDLVDSIGICGQ